MERSWKLEELPSSVEKEGYVDTYMRYRKEYGQGNDGMTFRREEAFKISHL